MKYYITDNNIPYTSIDINIFKFDDVFHRDKWVEKNLLNNKKLNEVFNKIPDYGFQLTNINQLILTNIKVKNKNANYIIIKDLKYERYLFYHINSIDMDGNNNTATLNLSLDIFMTYYEWLDEMKNFTLTTGHSNKLEYFNSSYDGGSSYVDEEEILQREPYKGEETVYDTVSDTAWMYLFEKIKEGEKGLEIYRNTLPNGQFIYLELPYKVKIAPIERIPIYTDDSVKTTFFYNSNPESSSYSLYNRKKNAIPFKHTYDLSLNIDENADNLFINMWGMENFTQQAGLIPSNYKYTYSGYTKLNFTQLVNNQGKEIPYVLKGNRVGNVDKINELINNEERYDGNDYLMSASNWYQFPIGNKFGVNWYIVPVMISYKDKKLTIRAMNFKEGKQYIPNLRTKTVEGTVYVLKNSDLKDESSIIYKETSTIVGSTGFGAYGGGEQVPSSKDVLTIRLLYQIATIPTGQWDTTRMIDYINDTKNNSNILGVKISNYNPVLVKLANKYDNGIKWSALSNISNDGFNLNKLDYRINDFNNTYKIKIPVKNAIEIISGVENYKLSIENVVDIEIQKQHITYDKESNEYNIKFIHHLLPVPNEYEERIEFISENTNVYNQRNIFNYEKEIIYGQNSFENYATNNPITSKLNPLKTFSSGVVGFGKGLIGGALAGGIGGLITGGTTGAISGGLGMLDSVASRQDMKRTPNSVSGTGNSYVDIFFNKRNIRFLLQHLVYYGKDRDNILTNIIKNGITRPYGRFTKDYKEIKRPYWNFIMIDNHWSDIYNNTNFNNEVPTNVKQELLNKLHIGVRVWNDEDNYLNYDNNNND